jgi:hypothetical protein
MWKIPGTSAAWMVGLKQANFWLRKSCRRAWQMAASRLYVNPDPDVRKSILVAGTARSGTTWLGDLIAMQIPCRVMFEPFNPDLVPQYRSFHYFQYMRPDQENPELHAYAQKLFSGEIRNRWIDHRNEHLFPKYRLIKEIRANLALKWLHDYFTQVPILFIVRHPCAVVSSRMELGWATDIDLLPFLSQPDLIQDFLVPFIDLIKGAKTDEEKHAVIWSISNLVPLRQFKTGEWKIVRYEDLCTKTEAELSSVFEFLGMGPDISSNVRTNLPSQTSRQTSAVVTGRDRINAWKKKMSVQQIDSILRVVNAFGLGDLYGTF